MTAAIGDRPPVMVGGPAALAEGAWMGAAQSAEVLELAHLAAPRRRLVVPRLPRRRLRAGVMAVPELTSRMESP